MKNLNALRRSAVLLSFLLLVGSCLSAQQIISASFSSNGQNRTYSGAIPNNPGSNLRLVILFCGAYEFGIEMHNRGFDNYLANNTMVIYPEPFVTGTSFGNPSVSNGADDYQMVEDLITHLIGSYSINTNDICIGGFSAGAMFSYGLICDFNSTTSTRPYKFKAMASVAGAVDESYLDYANCPIAAAVPLIAFHSTVDNMANYYGGDFLLNGNVSANIDTALHYWTTTVNGCNPNPWVTTLPDLVTEPINPSTVEFRDYGCQNSQRTHLYRIIDGMHSWPSGGASWDISSRRNQDIDASQLIADFFNTTPSVSNQEAVSISPSVKLFPNPAKTTLNLESEMAIQRISLYTTAGVTIYTQDHPNSIISLSHIPAGFYLIHIQTSLGTEVQHIIKE